MAEPPPGELNENHQRHLLASCQYAAKLLRDCEDVLSASEHPPALPRYAGQLPPLERKLIRDYLARLQQQLLHVLAAVGMTPPPPSIDAGRALRACLTMLDITFEEMRGRHMVGYGEVPPDKALVLDGVVTEVQGIVRDLSRLLARAPEQDLRARVEALPPDVACAEDLRRLEHIVTQHGVLDVRQALASILDGVAEREFEVAIFGRVSSGKSSLLNQLLGAPVLPIGVLPVTSVPTRIRAGAQPRLLVTDADGRESLVPIARIGEFVTEEGNPGNAKRLTRLVVEYPGPHLPPGVTFVDTPGLGSLATAGAVQTLAYLPRCDRGTLLVEASAPLGEEDVAVVAALREAGISASVLLSKADLLSAADLARVQRHVTRQLAGRLGAEVEVRPVSAKPEHHHLLAAWIAHDVSPLAGQARDAAREALAAKAQVLKRRVAAALRQRAARGPAAARPRLRDAEVAARVRATGARLEQVGRDVERLPELAPSRASRALADATAAFVEAIGRRDGHEAAVGAACAAVRAVGDAVANELVDELVALEREVRAVLADAAAVALVPAVPLEDVAVARDVPSFDLPPVSLVTTSPAWARLAGPLREAWARGHVEERCVAIVEASVTAHLHVLRAWARSAVARLRRQFDAESRPLLAQLEALAVSTPGSTPNDALEQDLAWLQADMGAAPSGAPAPAPVPGV